MADYSLIGRIGEMLDVVLLRLLMCSECGAIVLDTDLHDRYHEATSKKKP